MTILPEWSGQTNPDGLGFDADVEELGDAEDDVELCDGVPAPAEEVSADESTDDVVVGAPPPV